MRRAVRAPSRSTSLNSRTTAKRTTSRMLFCRATRSQGLSPSFKRAKIPGRPSERVSHYFTRTGHEDRTCGSMTDRLLLCTVLLASRASPPGFPRFPFCAVVWQSVMCVDNQEISSHTRCNGCLTSNISAAAAAAAIVHHTPNIRFLLLFLVALLSMPLHVRCFRHALCLRLPHGDVLQPLHRVPVVERPVGNADLCIQKQHTTKAQNTEIRSENQLRNKTHIANSYQQRHNEARQPSIHRVSEVAVHEADDPRDDLCSTTKTQDAKRYESRKSQSIIQTNMQSPARHLHQRLLRRG